MIELKVVRHPDRGAGYVVLLDDRRIGEVWALRSGRSARPDWRGYVEAPDSGGLNCHLQGFATRREWLRAARIVLALNADDGLCAGSMRPRA